MAVLASACGSTGERDDDRPVVVVTTTILGDIVAQTTGDAVRVESLVPIGADPHDFSPSARQAAALRDAVLVVANGVGLEEGLLDVIDAAEGDGVPVLRVGDLLDPQPLAGVSTEEARGLDPHVWLDPVRMADAVGLIADRLNSDVDVAGSSAAYRAKLLDLHDEIVRVTGDLPPERRKLVTNHDSFGYFAERYGFAVLGTVIPAATTGAETSAAEFAALVDLLERENVTVVFGSTTEPTSLAEALSDEVGHEVNVVKLYTGSLGEAGSDAETYLDMMRVNTRLIVDNLRPD